MFERANPLKNTDPDGHRAGVRSDPGDWWDAIKQYPEQAIQKISNFIDNANQAASEYHLDEVYDRSGPIKDSVDYWNWMEAENNEGRGFCSADEVPSIRKKGIFASISLGVSAAPGSNTAIRVTKHAFTTWNILFGDNLAESTYNAGHNFINSITNNLLYGFVNYARAKEIIGNTRSGGTGTRLSGGGNYYEYVTEDGRTYNTPDPNWKPTPGVPHYGDE